MVGWLTDGQPLDRSRGSARRTARGEEACMVTFAFSNFQAARVRCDMGIEYATVEHAGLVKLFVYRSWVTSQRWGLIRSG